MIIINLLIILSFLNYNNKNFNNLENNLKSFAIVKKYYQIESDCTFCSYYPEKFNFTISYINKFLKENPLLISSSFIAKKENNLNYTVTSNHVCESLSSKENDKNEVDSLKKLLTNTSVLYSLHRNELRFKKYIILEDINNDHHEVISFGKKNKDADICIMHSEDSWGKSITVSEYSPVIGDYLYNINSAMGIRAKNSFIIFEGIYSGVYDKYSFLSSIYAKPGSSGSPVFNDSGYLVGVIHTTFKSVKHVSMSTKVSIIRNLLYSK